MDHGRDIEDVALLREPVRRGLYFYVRRRGDPVGREEAARALRISRSLAAFHLDRLAEAGLLEVEYRRLTGRTGRGAGRPAKLYRPGRRVSVALPATRYELVGDLLLRAVAERRPGESPEDAVRHSARDYGRRLGEETPVRARTPMGRMREALEALGFEPVRRGAQLRLLNCPFHELVQRHPGMVCALNEAFIRGIADRLGDGAVAAEPLDAPGECCVLVRGREEA